MRDKARLEVDTGGFVVVLFGFVLSSLCRATVKECEVDAELSDLFILESKKSRAQGECAYG